MYTSNINTIMSLGNVTAELLFVLCEEDGEIHYYYCVYKYSEFVLADNTYQIMCDYYYISIYLFIMRSHLYNSDLFLNK